MDRIVALLMVGAVLVISVSAIDSSKLVVLTESPLFWEIGEIPPDEIKCDLRDPPSAGGPSFEMRFNNVSIPETSVERLVSKSFVRLSKSFKTPVTAAEAGDYSCVIKNETAESVKNVEVFTYDQLDSSRLITDASTTKAGKKVEFSCQLEHTPEALVYSWSTPDRKNITEPIEDRNFHISKDMFVLTLDEAKVNDSGSYLCEIRKQISPKYSFFVSAKANFTLNVTSEPSTTTTLTAALPTGASPTSEIHVPAVTDGQADFTSTAKNSGSAVFGALGLVLLSGLITL